MILSDRDIRARLEKDVVVRPLAENAVQPSSVDLRLGRLLRIAHFTGYHEHDLITDGPYHLTQLTFVLAATLEWIEVPDDLTATLAGKSTRARQGVVLENAGHIDSGWRGELTLELFMLSPRPLLLTHGMTIGQIRFEMLTSRCENPYGSDGLNSHYQRSRGPVAPLVGAGRPS